MYISCVVKVFLAHFNLSLTNVFLQGYPLLTCLLICYVYFVGLPCLLLKTCLGGYMCTGKEKSYLVLRNDMV